MINSEYECHSYYMIQVKINNEVLYIINAGDHTIGCFLYKDKNIIKFKKSNGVWISNQSDIVYIPEYEQDSGYVDPYNDNIIYEIACREYGIAIKVYTVKVVVDDTLNEIIFIDESHLKEYCSDIKDMYTESSISSVHEYFFGYGD